MASLYVTDCEGPITLDDNAFELCAHFIPDGAGFFTKISEYDDYLADVEKRPGYKAGDTLRLILPFLIAFGADNKTVEEYSEKHVVLVPGADKTLRFVSENMHARIVSTSYEPYIKALCRKTGFPFDNTYCTKLDLDKEIKDVKDIKEIDEVKEIKEEIDALKGPITDILKDLDNIFFKRLPEMKMGIVFQHVDPVGGKKKADALMDSLEKTGIPGEQTIYVGDSITDVQAFQAVKDAGGLAVSFNGNRYAIEVADIALISENTDVLTYVADSFLEGGKEEVFKLLHAWDMNIIEAVEIPRAAIVEQRNMKELIKESEAMRRKIRGMAGALG